MKQIKLITLIITLSLSLTACGSRNPEMAMIGTSDAIKDTYSYEIVKFEYKDKLEASKPGGNGIYYEPEDDSKFYMDLILEVKNETDDEAYPADLLEGSQFYLDHEPVNTAIYTESLDQTQIDSYGKIEADSKAYVHVVSSIDEDQKDLDIVLDLVLMEHASLLSIEPKKLHVEEQHVHAKQRISDEVLLNKAYVAKGLKPSNTDGDYSYYQAKDGFTYVIAQFSVITKESIPLEELLSVHAIVNDINTYKAVNLIEKKDGSHLSSNGTLEKGDMATIYALVEIPEEYDQLECKVSLVDTCYILDLDE